MSMGPLCWQELNFFWYKEVTFYHKSAVVDTAMHFHHWHLNNIGRLNKLLPQTPSSVYIKAFELWLHQQGSCCSHRPHHSTLHRGLMLRWSCTYQLHSPTYSNTATGLSPVKVLCRLSCLHPSLITGRQVSLFLWVNQLTEYPCAPVVPHPQSGFTRKKEQPTTNTEKWLYKWWCSVAALAQTVKIKAEDSNLFKQHLR